VAPTTHIEIKGQAELDRAFLQLRRQVLTEIKPRIVALAEFVRREAESQAVSGITNIGPRWERMRIGVTIKGAYVAPKSHRSTGPPRVNLFGELMDAMQSALDAKQEIVVAGMEELVTESSVASGFY
jgi:hypothetical protein